MTLDQFTEGIDILKNVFGAVHWPQHRILILWDAVNSLDAKWWRQQVDNAVLSSNSKYNFLDAIAFEKRRRAMEREAERVVEREQINSNMITNEGFQKILNHFKANSLLEAIESARKQLKGGENDEPQS